MAIYDPAWGLQPAPTGPAPGRGMPAPTPRGDNGVMGYVEAPVAGALGTAANVVQAGQAGAKALGFNNAADTAAGWAGYLRQAGAGFQSPELEQNAQQHPWSPSNIGYQVLKGAPGAVATLGGAIAAPEAVGPMLGGAIAAFPQMVGGNVETSEENNGHLTQGQAAKAIALGVPEAAIGGWSGGRAAQVLAGGIVAKSAARAAASQAFVGGVAGAGQDIIAQQMNDRSIPFRMNEMITSALTGGVTGALMGGGLHALAKANPTDITNEQLLDATKTVEPPKLLPPPAIKAGPPLDTVPAADLIARARAGDTAAMQEMMRRAGPSTPPPGPEPAEGIIPQPDLEHVGLGNETPFEQVPSLTDITRPPTAEDFEPSVSEPRFEHAPEQIPQPSVEHVGLGNERATPEHSLADITSPPTAEDFEAQGPEPAVPLTKQDIGSRLFGAMDHTNKETQSTSFLGALSDNERVGEVPLKGAKLRTAKALDVPVDEKGAIIPETAENAVPRDAFTTKTERANWDKAQDLRAQVAGEPAMTEALDKVQTTPDAPTVPDVLEAIQQHIASRPANENIEESPVEPQAPGAWSMSAWKQIQDIKKHTDRTGDRVLAQEMNKVVAAGPKAIWQTTSNHAYNGLSDFGKGIIAHLTNLHNADMRKAQAAELPPEPVTGPSEEAVAQAKPVDPVQASLSRLQDMTNVAKPGATPKAKRLVNELWQVGLQHDPTGTALWDDHLDKFSPEAQAALEAHGNVVADAQEKGLYGPRAAPTPPTQQGVDLEHIANNGGTLKDHLAYLQTSGENGAIKTVARLLLKNGVDAPVRISDEGLPDDRAGRYDRNNGGLISLRPGETTGSLVVHEAVHAATADAIDAGGAAAKEMNNLYESVKGLSPNNDAYGLTSVHEFVAEAFSNEDFRDHLRSLPADPSISGKPTSMWQAFKNAVARALGVGPGGQRTMLDRVMETGEQLIAQNRVMGASDELVAGQNASPLYASTNRVKQAQEFKGSLVNHLLGTVSSAKAALQHRLLGADGNVDIGTVVLPRLGIESGRHFVAALKDNENITNAMDSANVKAQGAYNSLNAKDKASIDKAIYLTNRGMYPDRTWKDQPAEMQEAAKKNPAIKQAWVDGSRAFNDASPAGQEAYALQVAGNQTQQLGSIAAIVHDSVTRAVGSIPGFENKPGKVFQFDEKMQSDPRKAQAALTADLSARGKSIDSLLAAGTLKPEQAKTLQNARGLIDQVIGANDAVPNFHMSHGQGDYFVAGSLAVGPEGRPTPAAVEGVQKILEAAGFGDRHLDVLNDNPALFARVENAGLATKLRAAFQEAAAAGHLDAEHGIKSGLAEEGGLEGLMPKQMKDYLKSLEASRPDTTGLDKAQADSMNAAWDQHINETRRGLMDLMPSSSATKLLAKKENVQLQTKDIGAAFQYRAAAASRRFGHLSTSSDYSAAISAMRDELKAVKSNPDIPIEKQELAQRALQQLLVNQVDRPTGPPTAAISALKGISYRMELASPAYAALLHSQVYTLVLPRLGSVVGYVKGAKYLAQSAPDMFRALKGMTLDEHWTTGGIRPDNMKTAKLSPEKASLLAEADNRGLISGSSFTKQMAPNEEGSGTLAKVANISSAFILYCEMHPRLLTVLAADRAWSEMPTERQGQFKGDKWNFIEQMVNKSSLDFSASNNARIQSRAGPLGETAPLFTQFTKFRSMLTTQLYRDFEAGFVRKDATPEERQQARSFLLGHLAATTMLAGSLGMPMVGVLASVADKLADWATGDPTHDFIASYRGWLTHMYGATAGEAIARGLPRLAGADFSKASEATLVPWVSDALMLGTEKRKLEDAEKDWLKKVAGPAIGLPMDWALGLRDIANGDYLRGMQKMVPEGLHGGVEAAEAMKYGFRDKNGMAERIGGHQLTPTASDIAMLALGIDPAKNAEYDEQQRVASGLDTRKQIQSQNITQHLLQAYQRGDQANFAYWENQAGPVWMSQHPGTEPPIAHFGAALNEHMRQQAMGLPQGLNVRDIRARGMIGFSNPH